MLPLQTLNTHILTHTPTAPDLLRDSDSKHESLLSKSPSISFAPENHPYCMYASVEATSSRDDMKCVCAHMHVYKCKSARVSSSRVKGWMESWDSSFIGRIKPSIRLTGTHSPVQTVSKEQGGGADITSWPLMRLLPPRAHWRGAVLAYYILPRYPYILMEHMALTCSSANKSSQWWRDVLKYK